MIIWSHNGIVIVPFLHIVTCNANLSWNTDRNNVALFVDNLGLHVGMHLPNSLGAHENWIVGRCLERYRTRIGRCSAMIKSKVL